MEKIAASTLKRELGLAAIIIIAAAPVLLWILMKPLDARLGSTAGILTSLGQISALIGMSLFSAAIMLSARLRWMEDYFKGLNRVYSIHHTLGGMAFSLLLLHPIALTIRYLLISLPAAFAFIIPGSNWAITFGIFALLTMNIVLGITFFARLPYDLWKLSHKAIGIAYVFASAHILLIQSDITGSLVLRSYMLALIAGGYAALIYRTVLGHALVMRHTFIVKDIRQLPAKVISITLEPVGKMLSYIPGQFIFVNFQGLEEYHPFTITSAPSERHISIMVKPLGDYTSKLSGLKPGTPAIVEGPYGRLSYKDGVHKQQIWIAGGIGITPFIAMAKAVAAEKEPYSIDLYHSVSTPAEEAITEELEGSGAETKGIRILHWVTEKQGKITAGRIHFMSKGLQDKDFLICGPPGMTKALINQLMM